ncbi:hypothetical protein [Kiloniella majae]|uniref:hypothetical protein n=1 Tax=Kiloniella majae TaxID=1938558 RepID=UPI000A278841|nr:hypothetical protein [Kiloniella majae]
MVEVIDHAEKLYGKSKPKSEPILGIETRPVKGTLGTKGHLYIFYSDGDKESVWSGSHENYPSLNTIDSNIIVSTGPIEESIDARNGQTSKQRGRKVLLSGTKAREGWSKLLKLKDKINNKEFDYDIIDGPNSNAVVNLGVNALGFKLEDVTPENDSYWDTGDRGHPGSQTLKLDKNGNPYETSIFEIPDINFPNPRKTTKRLVNEYNNREKQLLNSYKQRL